MGWNPLLQLQRYDPRVFTQAPFSQRPEKRRHSSMSKTEMFFRTWSYIRDTCLLKCMPRFKYSLLHIFAKNFLSWRKWQLRDKFPLRCTFTMPKWRKWKNWIRKEKKKERKKEKKWNFVFWNRTTSTDSIESLVSEWISSYWIRNGDSIQWQGMKQDLRLNGYQPLHYPTSPWKGVPHHRSLRPRLFTISSVGSFTCCKNQSSERAVRRNLRSFFLIQEDWNCICHNEGSTFSSVFFKPLVLARPGFEPTTSCSADRRLSNWAKRAAVSLLPHSSDRFTYFIRIFAENIQTFVVNESQVS